MRILWLTENYPPRRGGMAQACDRIVGNLRQSDLTVDIVFFSSGSAQTRTIQQQNGSLTFFAVESNPAHDLNCLWNYLNRAGSNLSYDCIAAFGGFYPLLALPVFKAWLGAKSVTLLRGNDFDISIFMPQRRSMLENALHASDCVCVLSHDQQEKIGKLFPDVFTAYIANGIDTESWLPDDSELKAARDWKAAEVPADRLLVGLIGQLKSKKGGIFFLESVLQANLNDRLHFLLVGDIEPQMQEWLAEKNEILSLTVIPFLDRFELLTRYPACDFIALPSHYDGMPNVLLEAGLLGIPAIAARAGGITDVIPTELANLTFHPGDSRDCARALWEAAQLSPEQRKNAGRLLSSRIKKEFSAASETQNYLKLFKKIIKSNPTNPGKRGKKCL